MANRLWDLLSELKAARWVDLTHPLDNTSPYWEGMPRGVVELGKTVVSFEEMNLHIQSFKFPGQFGTHIDYPAHFVQGARLGGDFDVKETVCPLVVINLVEAVKENVDYEITIDDILAHEAKYGRIPEGAFVAMRTDWSKRWPDNDALGNCDAEGQEHFPGWTIEVLEFLYDERGVAGTGHETLDTDAAVTCAKVGDLQAERYVLKRDKFQVEAITNLDLLPETGGIIFIAAPHIVEANGLPVRAWAVVQD